jgi:hypothetical protein
MSHGAAVSVEIEIVGSFERGQCQQVETIHHGFQRKVRRRIFLAPAELEPVTGGRAIQRNR